MPADSEYIQCDIYQCQIEKTGYHCIPNSTIVLMQEY